MGPHGHRFVDATDVAEPPTISRDDVMRLLSRAAAPMLVMLLAQLPSLACSNAADHSGRVAAPGSSRSATKSLGEAVLTDEDLPFGFEPWSDNPERELTGREFAARTGGQLDNEIRAAWVRGWNRFDSREWNGGTYRFQILVQSAVVEFRTVQQATQRITDVMRGVGSRPRRDTRTHVTFAAPGLVNAVATADTKEDEDPPLYYVQIGVRLERRILVTAVASQVGDTTLDDVEQFAAALAVRQDERAGAARA